jgi:hypothetical protein
MAIPAINPIVYGVVAMVERKRLRDLRELAGDVRSAYPPHQEQRTADECQECRRQHEPRERI